MSGTFIVAGAGGAAGAGGSCTLAAGGAGVWTYITGFHFLMLKTAAATTITSITIGAFANYVIGYAGDGVSKTQIDIEFAEPIPATAANTTIVCTVAALTGGAVWNLAVAGQQV